MSTVSKHTLNRLVHRKESVFESDKVAAHFDNQKVIGDVNVNQDYNFCCRAHEWNVLSTTRGDLNIAALSIFFLK